MSSAMSNSSMNLSAVAVVGRACAQSLRSIVTNARSASHATDAMREPERWADAIASLKSADAAWVSPSPSRRRSASAVKASAFARHGLHMGSRDSANSASANMRSGPERHVSALNIARAESLRLGSVRRRLRQGQVLDRRRPAVRDRRVASQRRGPAGEDRQRG